MVLVQMVGMRPGSYKCHYGGGLLGFCSSWMDGSMDGWMDRQTDRHIYNQWRTQEFFSGWGSTNSVEDRGQNGDLGCGSTLVRGSGGICNLVQEIPFHIVKLS